VCLQLLIAPFGIAFRFLAPNSAWFALCCVISSIYVTMMYGPVYATVQELTPLRIRATMIAFLIIWLNILGVSLGAVITAELSDYLGSYTWGILLTAQIGLFAVPLFVFAARGFERDSQRFMTSAEHVS